MRPIQIPGRTDDYQVLFSLKTNRHKRTRRGLIFVEGVAIINQLVRSGVGVEAVACSRTRPLSRWATSVLEATRPKRWYQLTDDLFAELSDREEPSELIVVAHRPQRSLAEIDPDSARLVVVLDRPASPGNLGSAIRSCDAFGADLVVVTGHAADIWDPHCMRASLGAVFTTAVIHEPSSARLLQWLDAARPAGAAPPSRRPPFRVIGTDSGGEIPIDDPSIAPPLALLFGNEATGLSQSLRAFVDAVVSIPMVGSVNSLNLASAVSVALYAVTRSGGGTHAARTERS